MIGYVLAKPGKLALGLQVFVNQTGLFNRVILETDIRVAEDDPNVLSSHFIVLKDDFELQGTLGFIAAIHRQNPGAKFLVLANNLDRVSAFQGAGIEMVVSEEISFEQLSRVIQQINTKNGTAGTNGNPPDMNKNEQDWSKPTNHTI